MKPKLVRPLKNYMFFNQNYGRYKKWVCRDRIKSVYPFSILLVLLFAFNERQTSLSLHEYLSFCFLKLFFTRLVMD
ncbi:hypothetical protein CLVI_22940 [Clostridium vincentii]|uniref:Uncharacterized protein n=1 Tax=Clostridium vincentii TaxID=52704 RepID=A0A2T0BCW4_9CLOT|nr:hypothetical protein CLVI_22940 [Clostridium vincentii]